MERQITVLICSSSPGQLLKTLDSIKGSDNKSSIFRMLTAVAQPRIIELMSRIVFDIVIVDNDISDSVSIRNNVINYDNEKNEVKILPENKSAVFYYMTAPASTEVYNTYLSAGFKDVVIKPFDLLLFSQKLKEDLNSMSTAIDVKLYSFNLTEVGTIASEITLSQISESHAVFFSNQKIEVGSRIRLSSKSLNGMSGEQQLAEVRSCEQVAPESFRIRVFFRCVDPSFTKAVRLAAVKEYASKKS